MTSTSDEVGHTDFDLEFFAYYVENPSAWEGGFDQRISDQMAKALAQIQRLRNSHDSLVKALEEIANHPTGGVGCNPVSFVETARAALSQAKGGK